MLHRRCCRLIPAHAGSTNLGSAQRSNSRAHPRSRGEHRCASHSPPKHQGSSPLTRGAPGGLAEAAELSRLIPAHAGSTLAGGSRPRRLGAHPRSRGEHQDPGQSAEANGGSSPLTRGALDASIAGRSHDRLIPAHAGSTPGAIYDQLVSEAHPRSRGEHDSPPSTDRSTVGSSPLTRGAPLPRRRRHQEGRLIPAHAGSTQSRSLRRRILPAHPRSRGEHFKESQVKLVENGSSPLTRGAH